MIYSIKSRWCRLSVQNDPSKVRDETFLSTPYDSKKKKLETMCRTKNSTQNDIRVRLKGMCDLSKMDTHFILNWMPLTGWYYLDNRKFYCFLLSIHFLHYIVWIISLFLTNSPWDLKKLWYQGERNTSIIYQGSGRWELSYSEFWTWSEETLKTLR